MVKRKAYKCQIMRKVLKKQIDVTPFLHFSIHFFVNIQDENLVQKYTELPKKMYTLFTHQYLWNKFKLNFYFRVRV